MGFKDSFDSFSRKVKDGIENIKTSSTVGRSSSSRGVRPNYQTGNSGRTGAASSGIVRSEKNSDRPAWLAILLRAGGYVAKTLATLLLIMVITTCIVGATAMVYVLAFLDKSVSDIDLTQLKLNYTTTIFAYD